VHVTTVLPSQALPSTEQIPGGAGQEQLATPEAPMHGLSLGHDMVLLIIRQLFESRVQVTSIPDTQVPPVIPLHWAGPS
jgi:hypothetical protein